MRNIYEAEETLLAMADIVKENRYLRERVEELRLKVGIYETRLYGMESLAQKLESRQRENLAYNSIRSMGGLSSDTKAFIDDMENLTLEELRFLEKI
jgi:hypothetical protein